MKILVDSNLFLRSAQPQHSQHQAAKFAVAGVIQNGHQVVVVPQIIYEFWVVATRPVDRNGLGLSAEQVSIDVDSILDASTMHRDERAVFDIWLELVSRHQVIGKIAHDARLVAAMLRHGITHILSFNKQDFLRFSDIVVIHPTDAASLPPAL
jgi:predicted nucleic acid-binding protein